MRLVAAGVNHKTAPVAVREQLALHPDHQAAVLRRLVALPGVAEALILSTCNRFELYLVQPPGGPTVAAEEMVGEATGADRETLAPHLYTYEDADAARHLF